MRPLAESETAVFEPLDPDECRALLRSRTVGRVAVADGFSAPLVLPVNFAVDGNDVVFRTDYGSKFRMAVLGEAPVTFQVDHIEPGIHTGWSVMIQGRAAELTPDEIDGLQLTPEPWVPGDKEHWVRISGDVITGRRVRFTDLCGFDGRGYA